VLSIITYTVGQKAWLEKAKSYIGWGLGRNQPQSKLAPTAEFIQLRGPQLILGGHRLRAYVGMFLMANEVAGLEPDMDP
jgi:hypothetical protein